MSKPILHGATARCSVGNTAREHEEEAPESNTLANKVSKATPSAARLTTPHANINTTRQKPLAELSGMSRASHPNKALAKQSEQKAWQGYPNMELLRATRWTTSHANTNDTSMHKQTHKQTE